MGRVSRDPDRESTSAANTALHSYCVYSVYQVPGYLLNMSTAVQLYPTGTLLWSYTVLSEGEA